MDNMILINISEFSECLRETIEKFNIKGRVQDSDTRHMICHHVMSTLKKCDKLKDKE